MRKFYFLVFVCFIAQMGYAQQTQHLVLYDVKSAQVVIPLSDMPELTFNGDSLNINTNNVVLQFPLNELARFVYEMRESSTGLLSSMVGEDVVTIENDVLLLHTSPGERAYLYTISGNVVADYCANSDGDILVPLFDFADGVYIMHYNGVSFKFRK